MEEGNNVTLEEKPKKLTVLKYWAVFTGLFTIVYLTCIFTTIALAYTHDHDSRPGTCSTFFCFHLIPDSNHSASLTLINETKTENSTTYDDSEQNLRNSTTDGLEYLPKKPLGFAAICAVMLYVHLLNSSIMFVYGALKEYQILLLPWMISIPTSLSGFLSAFIYYPSLADTRIWGADFQSFCVLGIIYITDVFMVEYFQLLVKKEKSIYNSRPIPTVLPGEEE